jgi:hypothetical protein
MMRWVLAVSFLSISAARAEDQPLNVPPEGFTALFNGKDLTNWKADPKTAMHWTVKDGVLHYDGKGRISLVTDKDYGDFILYVDWKIQKEGDSGIYLRGKPQVQIWDDVAAKKSKRPPGSGGLFNNQKGPNNPLVNADKPVGEWNTFKIQIVDDKVTVHLNGQLVVDNVVLENWPKYDSKLPAVGTIELQDHGNNLEFRNIFIKELK